MNELAWVLVKFNRIFFSKTFFNIMEDIRSFLWGHWYSCFVLLVTSALGFKVFSWKHFDSFILLLNVMITCSTDRFSDLTIRCNKRNKNTKIFLKDLSGLNFTNWIIDSGCGKAAKKISERWKSKLILLKLLNKLFCQHLKFGCGLSIYM